MRTDRRTDGRKDMTKLIVAFSNFANALKIGRIILYQWNKPVLEVLPLGVWFCVWIWISVILRALCFTTLVAGNIMPSYCFVTRLNSR